MSYNKIFKLTQANPETDEIVFSNTISSILELIWVNETTDAEVGGSVLTPITTNADGATCKLVRRGKNTDSFSELRKPGTTSSLVFGEGNLFGDIILDFIRTGSVKIKLENATANTVILVRILI